MSAEPGYQDIYSMGLHEILEVKSIPRIRVLRVAGGWIYIFNDGEMATQFVPSWYDLAPNKGDQG